MKTLICTVSLLFSLYTYADLTCSNSGTSLFYINGIRTSHADAVLSAKEINRTIVNASIDSGSIADFDTLYNPTYAYGIGDLIETSAQALYQNFRIDLNTAFQTIFKALFSIPVATKPSEEGMLKSITATIKKNVASLSQATHATDLGTMYSKLDTLALKKGKKVIFVSHSQGAFFANELIQLATANYPDASDYTERKINFK